MVVPKCLRELLFRLRTEVESAVDKHEIAHVFLHLFIKCVESFSKGVGKLFPKSFPTKKESTQENLTFKKRYVILNREHHAREEAMIKAAIFDFDGTIADTIDALTEGINLTMNHYGFPRRTKNEVRSFINNGARELVRCAMPRELQNQEDSVSRVLKTYNAFYGTVYLQTKQAYDGIPVVIRALHDMGFRIGVLSNKDDEFVKRLCEQVLIPGSYDHAQGVVEGKPTKPHPYLSELTAQSLGVLPPECVMIGDSDVDILTAANAHMQHIGVSWGYRSEELLQQKGATKIAHTPDELLKIISKLSDTKLIKKREKKHHAHG